MSIRRVLLNAWLRRVEKPRMARASNPDVLRRNFELQARLLFRAPRGTHQSWDALGTVDTLQVQPRGFSGNRVLFYVHGGGFVFGSPRTHAAMAAQLASRISARAVLPQYRLAPEAPFPAAPDDIMTAWRGLMAQGVDPKNVVLGGDSAGGALALGLLSQLCAQNVALPGTAFALSPLTDLDHSGDSFRSNAQGDVLLPAQRAGEMAQMFLAGHRCDDPRCSPLNGTFQGAPPVWLTVGDTEILRDDARRMADVLRRDGVRTALVERHDLPHVWPIMHNILPEARETLDALAVWIRQEQGWPAEN